MFARLKQWFGSHETESAQTSAPTDTEQVRDQPRQNIKANIEGVDYTLDSDEALSIAFQAAAKNSQLVGQFLEAQLNWQDIIDPRERFMVNGQLWQPTGTNGPLVTEDEFDVVPYWDEQELKHVRAIGRWLWRENPFAKAAHSHRENFVCGWGTTFTATSKPDANLPDESIRKVQGVIDAFLKRNNWHVRKPEILTRRDRDGECMLRKFTTELGLVIRFVESSSVFTPLDRSSNSAIKYGVESLEIEGEIDRETVVAYWINGKRVEASKIQHRRRGDSMAIRGIPIFWQARRHLIAAQKILRNGSAITEIQTAVGMIKRAIGATNTQLKAWADASANVKVTNNAPGYGTAHNPTTLHQRFDPGTIISTNENVEYDFPAMGVDPAKYVESLQAELRAAAASVCMSEAMFSAKSDDVNRASALIAEGPVTKAFERLQQEEAEYDIELIEADLDLAVERGLISQSERDGITITPGLPQLVSRDREAESKVRQADIAAGILSIQTATAEAGYKYDVEQANIEAHQERAGGSITPQMPIDSMSSPPDAIQSN